MNPIVAEMQDYYRQRAPVYDSSMKYDLTETVLALQPVIGLLQAEMAGKRVLEIACGPCFWTNFVSKTAVSILATDYNQTTLDQARQKPLDWQKIRLQTADAYHLSLLGETFEAAYAVDWFAHVPRSRFHDFLTSLHGRLEPGATVMLIDQLPGAHSITTNFDEEGNHLQERTLPDGSRYRVIKHFMNDGEINELFSQYSDVIHIHRYPEIRRLVIRYKL
ncbi:MAG: class I SAM-dependent methyltransferase [Chloroflexota bacterium]